jgi:hypothetical protein
MLMRDRKVLVSAVSGVVVAILLLLLIVALSDRPLFNMACLDGITRDGVTTQPYCVGGMFSLPLIGLLVVAAGIGTSIIWWALNRRNHGDA